MLRRKPKPIETNLSEDDLTLFTEIAARKQLSPELLLQQIIHDWLEQERTNSPITAISPAAEIHLSQECAVLLANETLQQFTARIQLHLIKQTVANEGGMQNAAHRLSIHRCALSKKLSRLLRAMNGSSSNNTTPPLADKIIEPEILATT